PSGPPMIPVAGTGNPKHDWPLEYERTAGGPEADLVVRTGDINNLGFGWPQGFDPFSGQSTPAHAFPDINHIPPNAPPGTDRIMIGTGVTPVHMHLQHRTGELDRVMVDALTMTKSGDGYSWSLDACYGLRPSISGLPQTTDHIQLPRGMSDDVLWAHTSEAAQCTRNRALTMPMPIVLDVGELPRKINSVVVQIFADDFQAPVYHSHFQVSLNGTRIPTFEYVINSLDQSGPIGKLVTMKLLPEYWPLLKSGTVKLLIDDPTTHVQDGYAIDFVRILANPHKFKYQVSLTATVTDADTHKPIAGATVSAGLTSAAADRQGKCQLTGIPAGLVVATASAPGYDENSVPVDLPAGQAGSADIQLHRHQETTAALEQSIAQTGSATIYGIHFDTNSPNFRSDSLPALNAVLGLIHNHPGSKWLISGHTDNQGNAAHNQMLSVARAKSVVAWLKQHGVDVSRLVPQGFGATRPVADNATANGRFLNRRVEVALAR
ncbi:MAG: OmpA family protein, partial [Candidatus Acidiferrales bacterium]